MKSLRDSACEYGLKGWQVLPLMPKSKVPNGMLVPSGFKDATSYLPEILTWWEEEPNGNIGVYCRGSGLVVIDIDPRNGGDVNHDFPKTLEAITPSGGRHLIYKHPQKPCKGKLGEGVDVKDNGYIVVFPSKAYVGNHITNYYWINELEPVEAPLEILRPTTEYTKPAWKSPLALGELMDISAFEYVSRLTGRSSIGCDWFQCPFHLEGQEKTPSFYVHNTLWCCFGGCESLDGQEVFGGSIITFAAKLWGYDPRPRGEEFLEVKKRLEIEFCQS